MRGLEGKVALVTGGSGGIGSAVCRRFAEEGAAVIVADHDEDGARRLAAELSHGGASSTGVRLDVSRRDSWRALLDGLGADFRPLDILVNVAGITRDRSLARMSDEEWDAVLAVNLKGSWLGCQAAFEAMGAGGGAIVNIASTAIFGTFGQANYSAAKSGIVGLTNTAAIEGARRGIRVNAVAPGVIDTAMVAAVPEDIRSGWTRKILLGRFGAPAEIASVVAFLASADAQYVTGQTVIVDGGATTGDF